MKKSVVNENTAPTETISGQFKADLRFLGLLSKAKCSKGRFLVNGALMGVTSCGGCVQVPNSAIIDKAKTRIKAEKAAK